MMPIHFKNSELQTNLTVYPHRYKDGTWMKGQIEDRVDAKTQEWLDNIEPFVKAITPQSDH